MSCYIEKLEKTVYNNECTHRKGGVAMQDSYIGDIGDYGKYGLLREVCEEALSLSVNWYRVVPKKIGKQYDGKYISYLTMPQLYREYDPTLYDSLYKIVKQEQDRRIVRVEKERLFEAVYFSKEIGTDRLGWHRQALEQTNGTDVVFLDPDNGLETAKMYQTGGATDKHVKWKELKDYYIRGQNVILYQHRPQITRKEQCIENIMVFQREYLQADAVRILEFPKYTNRFYFMFLHEGAESAFERICSSMAQKWSKNEFCREIILSQDI